MVRCSVQNTKRGGIEVFFEPVFLEFTTFLAKAVDRYARGPQNLYFQVIIGTALLTAAGRLINDVANDLIDCIYGQTN